MNSVLTCGASKANSYQYWQEAARCLAVADALEGHSRFSSREAAASRAYTWGALSAANFCIGATLSQLPDGGARLKDLIRGEIEVTERFLAVWQTHPWVWGNSCWEPQNTVMAQRGLGIDRKEHKNAFAAKLDVMRRLLR